MIEGEINSSVPIGNPVRIICTLAKPPEPKTVAAAPTPPKETVLTEGEDEDIIKIAEEIFGN